MAKKKSKNQGEKQNNGQQNKDDAVKGDGSITVVLKVDLHCDGCAVKVIKSIRSFEGVESVRRGDGDSNKLTVVGKVDPVKLQENVEQKTNKKVELISPSPKKDKSNDKDYGKSKDGVGGAKKTQDKPEEKKSKEPPLTTAVLRVNLHCEGCIQKINKIVSKTKGYQEMSVDRSKDLITVKGTMDMKTLAESVKEKLKKSVEIVPPKKEKGGEGGGGQGKGGGERKGAGDDGGDGGGKAEGNRMEYVPMGYPYPYVHGPPGYVMMDPYNLHAPQMFSDENPHACSVM